MKAISMNPQLFLHSVENETDPCYYLYLNRSLVKCDCLHKFSQRYLHDSTFLSLGKSKK